MANFSKMRRAVIVIALGASIPLTCQIAFAEQDNGQESIELSFDQSETSAAADASMQTTDIKPAESDVSNSADQSNTAYVENAEGAAEINNTQTIDDQPGASTSEMQEPAHVDIPSESAIDAGGAQIPKGGRMSLRQKVAVDKAALSKVNRQQGDDFLATNKARQNMVSLPSGVQYKILREGKGKNPTENSVLLCRYQGTLIDGTVFDESDAKQPVTLNVTGLLPGLKEAIKLMTTGSKWQIVVPPQLAYGDRGDRGVGPNAVLIYDMEILATN
ncbi:MAG: FKBP-type peptidyl-prolyl cis-trans isomerase [Gallionella sp.]|jgi:FKBP-type peptidyl-prolyl cis-trans isomerase